MSLFELYLRLGFKHIVDVNGFDHIVFLIALCAGYNYSQFRKIVIFVTVFTVGHTLTLALATLKIVSIPVRIVEFLIPLTILIAAISNLVGSGNGNSKILYAATLFFGLIHGLGFSNYLQGLMGKETSLLIPLLAFNIGVELGQIVVVAVYFTVLFLFMVLGKINHRSWKTFITGAAFGVAVVLLLENRIW